ncbi:unnamed protein product, partial [Anisakis simplex]|uniref:glutathione transferase n=1 Tax=Anisakis simplex TaxID=6269 RepID=A0A0M3IZ45_ANISI
VLVVAFCCCNIGSVYGTDSETTNDGQQGNTTYKLTYFNARFRAECARLIFAQAGVPYEDNRISHEEWEKIKPSAIFCLPSIKNERIEVRSSTPFGHLPLLEFDGNQLGESYAINRYLARTFGLAGNSSLEEAYIDSIASSFKDFFESTIKAVRALARKENVNASTMETIDKARGQFMPPLQKFLDKAGSGYVVGKSLSWADLLITEYLATIQSVIPDFLKNYPTVEKYVNDVRKLPNIAKWLEERPKTPY